MSKRKIYIVGYYGREYANWCEGEITEDMKDASIVLFTGGEDVSPSLYGKKRHQTTYANPQRDYKEVQEFRAAKDMGKAMLGICRGAQFLCVMAGGKLVQNQWHPSNHDVTTNDGRIIKVTSLHHQRQYIQGLPPDKVELIAWAEHLSPYAHGETDDDKLDEDREVEVAYYPEIKALAIQSHPEFAYPCRQEWHEEYITYCRELLNKYLS